MNEGDRYHMSVDMNTGAAGYNMDMIISVDMTVVKKEDEQYIMSLQYDRMKLTMGEVDYDSDQVSESMIAKRMEGLMRPIMDLKMEAAMSLKGRMTLITDVQGHFADRPEMTPIVSGFSDQMSQQAISFPDQAIKVGDSWDAELDRSSNGQDMRMKVKYTLDSVDDEHINISMKGTVESKGRATNGKVTGKMQLYRSSCLVKYSEMDMKLETSGISVPVTVKMTGEYTPAQ